MKSLNKVTPPVFVCGKTEIHSGMDPRRIPFITMNSYESSESDNDVEPKTRFFKRQRNKKSSISSVPQRLATASNIPIPATTVSKHSEGIFVHEFSAT